MSKLFKKTTLSPRALQNAWMNNIFQSHDLWCECQDPLKHLEDIINKEKCRHFKDAETTTETGGDTKTEETGFDDGDLERLFAQSDDDEG